MAFDVQGLIQEGAARTDAALERLLPGAEVQPHSIHRAMRHSVFAGENGCGRCWRWKLHAWLGVSCQLALRSWGRRLRCCIRTR